ncbi:MAG: hypothetical protein KDA75_13095, partial [Planctomycetaceae bacterium]|nr:hypothetical protein [Planctomycetaceae bacterium]
MHQIAAKYVGRARFPLVGLILALGCLAGFLLLRRWHIDSSAERRGALLIRDHEDRPTAITYVDQEIGPDDFSIVSELAS